MAKVQFEKEMKSIQVALEAIASIEKNQRQFAINTIANRLGLTTPSPIFMGNNATQQYNQKNSVDLVSSNVLQNNQSPKVFLASKKCSTAVEQIACLAYFLTHSENKAHFKTRDLTDLNTKAAGTPFSNAAQASVAALRQSRFLAPAGKGGLRQITTLGEEVVKALPDREMVKAAILAHKGTKRKSRKKAKATS